MNGITISGLRRIPESDAERMAAMERQIADLRAQVVALAEQCDDLRNECVALRATEANLRAMLAAAPEVE